MCSRCKYFAWFRGETTLEHVGLQFAPPSAPHTLISNMNSYPERERNSRLCILHTGLSLSTSTEPSTWVASRLVPQLQGLIWRNLIW